MSHTCLCLLNAYLRKDCAGSHEEVRLGEHRWLNKVLAMRLDSRETAFYYGWRLSNSLLTSLAAVGSQQNRQPIMQLLPNPHVIERTSVPSSYQSLPPHIKHTNPSSNPINQNHHRNHGRQSRHQPLPLHHPHRARIPPRLRCRQPPSIPIHNGPTTRT